MNPQKEYFIYLLSCFLSGKTPKGREAEWKEIWRLADINDVGAIISQEIKELPEEFRPQGELKSKYTRNIGYAVIESEIKNNALKKANAFFTENDIDHLFVKWAVIKDYYPVAELRTSGDIDVIVRDSEFNNVVKLVQQTGFKVINRSADVISVEIDEAELEIHRTADVKSSYFDNPFSLCIKNGNTYSLSDYDHLLYIICHLAKHLSYRGAGIRMLMDIDVLIRNIPSFSRERIIELSEIAGVKKTALALLSLCSYWFDTPVEPYIDFTENFGLLNSFENVLIDGGSFGYETNAIPARYFKKNDSRFKIAFKMAFPDKEYLKICYPYYKKHGFLYPAARINRLLDGVLKKRKVALNVANQLKADEKTNSYQLELLEELEIDY